MGVRAWEEVCVGDAYLIGWFVSFPEGKRTLWAKVRASGESIDSGGKKPRIDPGSPGGDGSQKEAEECALTQTYELTQVLNACTHACVTHSVPV